MKNTYITPPLDFGLLLDWTRGQRLALLPNSWAMQLGKIGNRKIGLKKKKNRS